MRRHFSKSVFDVPLRFGARCRTPCPVEAEYGPSGLATMAKQSPPIPVICGSTTARVAAAATAASTALPPSFRICRAVAEASGCEVAAMPFSAKTAERPGSWKLRGTDTAPEKQL
jgi:hypothetical protein